MPKDSYENDKKREITELISSIISSRINLTTHREIAAWTITAFYITAIIATYKYLIALRF